MGSKVKIALELAEMIKDINASGRDGRERIPNTETHMKEWCAHFAMEETAIRKILTELKDAHYIFVINIVVPDTNLFLPGTDSFVYAESSLLNDLKRYSELRLEKTYESTFYKKKSPFQIIKELFPKAKEYNNTPMGKALNEAVMIEEFSRVLANSAVEYTDSWKKNKIKDIYSEADEEVPSLEEELEQKSRAIDQLPKEKDNSENPNSQWSKVTNSFPIEFLLRIHFRKYEFDTVKKLIQTGKIKDEENLKYIRDTLQTMESRTSQDTILKRHLNEMIELRRITQGKLNLLRTNPRKN
ncbi:MAG: hypothetical protein JJT78_01625 [Leptospira sp.]|nr:hypothetical protein [Leptospira sp.]